MGSGELLGRTAVVTGASRGIGLAIAASLCAEGANVILTARRQEDAEAAAAGLNGQALGYGAHAVDEDSARGCVEFALDRFGSLDILVNNAGTNPAFGPLVDQDHGRFAKTMDVNLWAPILWSGLAWRAWMKEHGGAIVNTASVGGLAVGENLGIYHASKAALIHMTRHLALELAPKVRVNAVAPGVIKTRLAEALWKEHEEAVIRSTPLARVGEPGDIGDVVAFLASDRARWITGETVVADGGQMVFPAGEIAADASA